MTLEFPHCAHGLLVSLRTPSPPTPHFSPPHPVSPSATPPALQPIGSAASGPAANHSGRRPRSPRSSRANPRPVRGRLGPRGCAGAEPSPPPRCPRSPPGPSVRPSAEPQRDLTVGPRRGRRCPAAGGCGHGEPGLSAGRVRDGRGGNRPGAPGWAVVPRVCGLREE